MKYRVIVIFVFLIYSKFCALAQQDRSLEQFLFGPDLQFEVADAPLWIPGENGNYLDYTIEGSSLLLKEFKINKSIVAEYDIALSDSIQISDVTPLGNKLYLVASNTEYIYRHSAKSIYFLFNGNKNSFTPIAKNKIAYPHFSPDKSKIAYTLNNNLYYKDLFSDNTIQVTFDGNENKIINGSSDWVYEEEFGLTRAFDWSPDGTKLCYLRFDESDVMMYDLQMWGKKNYPETYKFKYPKVGKKNSIVDVRYYDLMRQKTTTLLSTKDEDVYYPFIQWTAASSQFVIQKFNRFQNEFSLLLMDVSDKTSKTIYVEKNDTYVEKPAFIEFSKTIPSKFWISSEKSGYRQVYELDWKLNSEKQITKGNYEVKSVCGIDERNEVLFYTSAELSSRDELLYRISLKDGKKDCLQNKAGVHSIAFTSDYTYYTDTYSTLNLPTVANVYRTKNNKCISVEKESTSMIQEKRNQFSLAYIESGEHKFDTETTLNYWIMKPSNFDSTKKYPVLLTFYGGPGVQTCANQWLGFNYKWYQYLCRQGIVVMSIDGRGTGGKGAAFKKCTQGQLGKYESDDLIAAAKWLKKQLWVRGSSIGAFGWSYGGFLSSLCITKGAEEFTSAVSVAPVSHWKYYDNIYTERYMKTPAENAQGYEINTPMNYAEKLNGDFLLIHGTGDDNVHIQHAYALQNALIKAGKLFSTFYYPDRNHGIYGGNTRIHLYKMMTDFLVKSLKK